MDDLNHLFGTCSCQRNQYTVLIPRSSAHHARVFFDNSVVARRTQAAPLTAWLRVPLEWYHSSTFAQFPDETHASIKRTYYTPSSFAASGPGHSGSVAVTRRQFCGYCGTHLTAWHEGERDRGAGAGYMDVTLGSLLAESLERLRGLGVYEDLDEDSESGLVSPRELEEEVKEMQSGLTGGRKVDQDAHILNTQQQDLGAGLVQGGSVQRETHIPTNEPAVERESGSLQRETHIPTNEVAMGGVDGPSIQKETHVPTNEQSVGGVDGPPVARRPVEHWMVGRGMPYFEEMIENSRLGRIKRQKGAHVSADGRTRVEWEVVEVGGDDEPIEATTSSSSTAAPAGLDVGANKRMRIDM